MFFKNNTLRLRSGQARSASSGFTLIEMLVVVAIVGILSATVLSALGPARNKAKDARIISGINQVRAIAEVVYNPGSGAPYSGLSASTPAEMIKITADISSQGGELFVNVNTGTPPGTSYVAYSKLASNPLTYYCVDSSGNTKTTTLTSGAVSVNTIPVAVSPIVCQ